MHEIKLGNGKLFPQPNINVTPQSLLKNTGGGIKNYKINSE